MQRCKQQVRLLHYFLLLTFVFTYQIFSDMTFFFSHSFSFVFGFVTNKSPHSNINLTFFFGNAKIFHSSLTQAPRHKTNISLTRAVMIVDRIPKNFVVNLQAWCSFTAGVEVWRDRCSLPCKLFGAIITRKLLNEIFQVFIMECRIF